MAPSPAMASALACATEADRYTRALQPTLRAVCATARPWLPSLAQTSVSPVRIDPSCISCSIAKRAPSSLNAFRPKRAVSSFASSVPSPSVFASCGSDVRGVGVSAGWPRKNRSTEAYSSAENSPRDDVAGARDRGGGRVS